MKYYYINPASEQVGPADIEQLKKDEIARETLVWKEGMKDWIPAGTVPELQVLFTTAPPPLPDVKKSIAQSSHHATTTTGTPPNKNLKKILIPAAAILAIAVIFAFIYFRADESIAADNKVGNLDSSITVQNDTITKEETTKTDTVKLVNMDSLANNLHWDTSVKTETAETKDNVSSFIPGFGTNASSSSKKNKKTTAKKTPKYTPDQQNDQGPRQSTEPERTEPERINPVKYLSITGSFRKNLLFEAILEGTIQNRYSGQIKDIILEVRFLDASGQSISTKRFTQHGPLAGGASIPFKFKTMPPKGTKGAKYEIAGASLK